ncbi:hypothetical protein A9Z06_24200 [Rhizobium sp. YK2]|nr:hypothetical protein A9Z06_24200 [Rhizobium sp. YK2]
MAQTSAFSLLPSGEKVADRPDEGDASQSDARPETRWKEACPLLRNPLIHPTGTFSPRGEGERKRLQSSPERYRAMLKEYG